MQTWARRGLQTALVTGGLLMLGTGIASAGENVNPDRPASPIDGGASAPVHAGDNAIGTPAGQIRPATVDRTVRTDAVTGDGNADSAGRNTMTAQGGDRDRHGTGYVLTNGDPSALSGNAVPGETKTIRAGGSPNSDDDNGTASSNVVSAPTGLPAQFFGDAAGVAANTGSEADNATAVFAGGEPTATGRSGSGSGNIVHLPNATPAQVFSDGASVIGNGHTTGTGDTTVWSGGTARADGTAADKVVTVPDAGPVQAFGVAAASPGNEEADSLDNTSTTAGADTVTGGDRGALAGNVVTAPITQVEQVFATGLAAAGNSTANGFDDTATTSGGNVRTSGEWGALSGDLVGIPATDVTRAASDGVGALGNQQAFSHNTTSAVSGGTTRTAGNGPLDGTPLIVPLPVNAAVFRVPVEVLGRAVDNGYQRVITDDGDTAPRIDLPFGQQAEFGPSDAVDDLLRADQVPALGGLARPRGPMPTMDMTQVFPVLSDGVPGLSTMEMTQQMPVVRPAPRNTPYDPTPAYQPMTGELPVAGGSRVPVASANLPTVTKSVPSGASGLPDLPPVPTLPPVPPLRGGPSTQSRPGGLFTPYDDGPVTQQLHVIPGLPRAPRLQAPQVSAPSLPRFQPPRVSGPLTGTRPSAQDLPATPSFPVQAPRLSTPPLQAPELTGPITGAGPATQDVPAGAAQQLMAQLRGLISELENSGSSEGMHPLDVRTPDRMEPPAL
ncbi:MAG TPA: hypothetical protein VHV74_23265 [Pseudonocardiaceae bacterium]|jgi:hypothetical protein|nr:hypothetical protein [Pseudonocardiaceae bacterium]